MARHIWPIFVGACFFVLVAQGELKFTGKKEILALYQLMKDTHELLVKHNIPYWIDAGTLLGAVRHGGIIPWDNDLDICVAQEDVPRLKKLSKEFKKIGHAKLSSCEYGFQVKQTAWLDFFITARDGDKIWYRKKATRATWRRGESPLYITAEELYPLKLYQFGEFQVYGPNDPLPYLYAYYGKDCLDTGYMQLSGKPNDFEKSGTQLTDVLKKPALPTGPLKDKVR